MEVVIWDVDAPLPENGINKEKVIVVLWSKYCNIVAKDLVSIPVLVERDADKFKSQYLSWIYDLGDFQVAGRKVHENFQIRKGYSYWWATLVAHKCNWILSRRISDAVKLMAFDNWISSVSSVTGIRLFSQNRDLAQCVKELALDMRINFYGPLICISTPKLSDVYNYILKPNKRQKFTLVVFFSAIALLLKHLVSRWPMRNVGVAEWSNSSSKLVLFSYLFGASSDSIRDGKYESPYWTTLLKHMKAVGVGINFLHIYCPDKVLCNADDAAKAIRQFNANSSGNQVHVSLDSFLSIKIVFQAVCDWARVICRSINLNKNLKMVRSHRLNLWPLIKNDWRESIYGFTGLSNLLYLNLFESAMSLVPKQRVGVYLQENQGWEFGLLAAWRHYGHQHIIGYPHATVRYWDLRYFYDPRSYTPGVLPKPDYIAVNGEASKGEYRDSGYPMNDIVDVEALRYLHLLDFENREVVDNASKSGRQFKLLVLGDYDRQCTDYQMNLLLDAVVRSDLNMSIFVKPHPACSIEVGDYPRLHYAVTNEPIPSLLLDCDAVFTSSATSAAVDAYCAGVPVISAIDPVTLNLSPLRLNPDIMFVSTPEDLVSVLSMGDKLRRYPNNMNKIFFLDAELPRWMKVLIPYLSIDSALAAP